MSFRKVVLGMLIVWLCLMGVASGFLCLLALLVLLVSQGLGISTTVLAIICVVCLGSVCLLLRRVVEAEGRLTGAGGRYPTS
jgi:hypothetical protein